MKTLQRIVTACLPVLALACNPNQDQKIAQDEAQSIVNSAASEGAATIDYADQFEAADIVGVQAVDADTIAANLANRINTNHAGCAAAVSAANVVNVDWGCTIGEGDQAVTVDGTTTVTVEIVDQSVVFTGTSDALNSNGLTLDSTTIFTVIPGEQTATIERDVTFTKGDDTLTIQLDGTAVFDNSGPARRVTIDAVREVQLNDLNRTQTWTDVVFEEGLRLPVSGVIDVDGAVRDVNAIFTQDANIVTIDVTVVNRRGESNFIFTVDTTNGDTVEPAE
jgi:hypothetical protein